jgi:hypothetical protein
MSPEEAHYAAMRKFGNVMRVKEETREVWNVVWLDIRFGLYGIDYSEISFAARRA